MKSKYFSIIQSGNSKLNFCLINIFGTLHLRWLMGLICEYRIILRSFTYVKAFSLILTIRSTFSIIFQQRCLGFGRVIARSIFEGRVLQFIQFRLLFKSYGIWNLENAFFLVFNKKFSRNCYKISMEQKETHKKLTPFPPYWPFLYIHITVPSSYKYMYLRKDAPF